MLAWEGVKVTDRTKTRGLARLAIPVACVAVAVSATGLWWSLSSGRYTSTATSTDTLELSGAEAWDRVTLSLRSIVGDITVEGDPDLDAVRVEVTRTVNARSDSRAERALTERQPFLRWSGDGATASLGTDESGDGPGFELITEWLVLVPAAMQVSVRNDVGTVEVSDVAGEIRVRTDVGGVTVIDAGGTVHAATDVGDVRVASTGDVTARSDAGRVWINGVEQ